MKIESTQTTIAQQRERANTGALLSAFVPGLGQLTQRRFMAAGVQCGTVVAYLAGALAVGGRRALLFALLWNLWSVVDAYRHEAD